MSLKAFHWMDWSLHPLTFICNTENGRMAGINQIGYMARPFAHLKPDFVQAGFESSGHAGAGWQILHRH